MNQTRKGTADSRSHHGTNSFDAAVDAFYSAMKKIGYPSVPIDASSISWPSAGGECIVPTTFEVLAYNKILVRHLAERKGTRKNLRRAIDAYFFTLSNSKRDLEDKPASWTIGLHLYTILQETTRDGTVDSRSHHGINSFDATVDAFYSAMKKIFFLSVPIDASSIGLPSAGGEPIVTTTFDVLAYNQILVRHMAERKGTRKNLRRPINAYLFTLSNSKRDPEDNQCLPLEYQSCKKRQETTRNGTADSHSHHGTNSFDAAVDAFYSTMKKIGYPSVPIDASSIIWPSAGGEPIVTTTFDVLAYNQILVRHLAERKGTRKNLRRPIDAYLFTLSNSKRDPEDKPASWTIELHLYTLLLNFSLRMNSRSHHGINSFDAMVDVFYSAMKKIFFLSVPIDASSIGWPSSGGERIVTTTFDVLAYNQILVRHLAERKGTRKNLRRPIDAYLFSLSNSKRDLEDKPASWTIGLHLYTMLLNFSLRMIDTFYSAMKKIGYPSVPIDASSIIWPSAGGEPIVTTTFDVLCYNQILNMNQTRNGTADSRSHHGTNSFDAAVDAFYSAMKKIGYHSVPIDASSIIWPSAGGEPIVTTTFDVLGYNQILVRHLAERKGTRKNLRRPIDAYLITLSNSKRDPEDKPTSWTIGLHLYTLMLNFSLRMSHRS
ncbi:putative glucan endo-1-3-beta-glucosidase [Nymphaea thermarum]|nr:putative glucan endo-1-3-beta-glucosidase [Nymphaea thermarum]